MKKIQYCTCRINLSGQNCHTVVYDEFNAVSWPEVQILMALHDEENVMDVMPVRIGECWPSQEKERLLSLYSARVVEAVFPGRSPRMELVMTGEEDLPPPAKETPPSTKVHAGRNGDDDEDDGEDETIKAPATLEPIFKPGKQRPAATAKEA